MVHLIDFDFLGNIMHRTLHTGQTRDASVAVQLTALPLLTARHKNATRQTAQVDITKVGRL
jgi:hypothetical protein